MKQILAPVTSITPVGEYFHLKVAAPEIAPEVLPGHFVALGVGGPGSGMLLRRAFSIHEATSEGIEIIFAAKGQGTQWLKTVAVNDQLDIIAPLGQPFTIPDDIRGAVLVAGGYGAAPMGMLLRALKKRGCQVEVVLGAATAGKLFGVSQLSLGADHVTVTTDDGSQGLKGRVSLALPDAIDRVSASVVYACGPMPMLRAVAQIASQSSARSQCAVEESMACGIGVCMTCVMPVVGDDDVTRMVRSCVEGPVFDGTKVRWDDMHTIPSDTWGAPIAGGH